MITKKYNSINDQFALQMRNANNTIELLTKIDQALNNNDSFILVDTVDGAGNQVQVQVPTIGHFKEQLEQLRKNINILSGIDGNTSYLQLAENEFKRIIVADLNLEPNPISSLNPVSTFTTTPNYFFDKFLNPRLAVSIDLTDKIKQYTKTINVKRFIVEFDKQITPQENGQDLVELTPTAKLRLNEFNVKYKGKANINIVEFVTWLDTPGLINRVDDTLIDQEFVSLDPNRLRHKGNFTVLNTELDVTNNKLWYILDTLNYYDISQSSTTPKIIQLKVGDYVNVNSNLANVTSTTVYKIAEISTITSDLRVRFELAYGNEPISIRLNALSFYSDIVSAKTIKVGVGFDEYNVVFLKPVNDNNNLISSEWSPGIGFYSNELRLDNNAGQLLNEYYVSKVYDYGAILDDLLLKKVPNYYGIKPNAVTLNARNFKVVQINQHLTNSIQAEELRDLQNKKNNIVSEVKQISDAIDKQNRLIQTTSFTSQADRKKADDELATLQSKLNAGNNNKASIVQNILANVKNLNKINPVYHLRGIFPMPVAATSTATDPQEVVQFEIWYRRLAKSGTENPILTISDIDNAAARSASTTNTTVSTNSTQPNVVNGAFSNWQKYKTDARKRVQDPITQTWKWVIEDVADANTPNINQLDIQINPGEKLQIKVKSLSEVGWPETPIESEFSNLLEFEFPDDLNNVLNADQFILPEAQIEDVKIKLQQDLEARGLGLHLSSALRVDNKYYPHGAEDIFYKENNGTLINAKAKIEQLENQITALQNQINRAKGKLEIYLVNKGNKIQLFNGNNLQLNLNLENYLTPTKVGLINYPIDLGNRVYKNELMVINDYSLLIKNPIADSPLGLLSYRGYGNYPGLNASDFAYNGANANNNTFGMQAIWIQPDGHILMESQDPGVATVLESPKYATQKNHQWIWLDIKDASGNYIYDCDANPDKMDNNYWDSDTTLLEDNGNNSTHNKITSKTYNLGFATGIDQVQAAIAGTKNDNITDVHNWEINESFTDVDVLTNLISGNGGMGSTIHPVISGFNAIVDNSNQSIKYLNEGADNDILIPIYIYAKPYTGTGLVLPSTGAATSKTKNTSEVPVVDLSGNNISRDGVSGKMLVKFTSGSLILPSGSGPNIVLKPGDKVIFSGFTDTSLIVLNNKLLTVIGTDSTVPAIAAPQILFDYVLPSGFAAINQPSLITEQVHKVVKYTNPAGLSGSDLIPYNVITTNATDNRIAANYVEIKTHSNNSAFQPAIHNKKMRLLIEDENNVRPFEFQLSFNLYQYKKVITNLMSNDVNNVSNNA